MVIYNLEFLYLYKDDLPKGHCVGASAPSLRVIKESKIEGYKHQDNADVHYQPFPESILKEQ
jgi:hypothetical protein